MKLKALLLIAALHFAALASCAGETAERPGASAPDGNSGDTGGGTTIDLTGYRLIFADEFDGRRMNWDLWAADDPNNIKNETSRGPEAVEVRDGELRLNVRRVNRSEKVKWIAGYVYLKEPLENNVYIECRFRSGQCPGVNNAFWLACKTPPNTTWCNKYEVDIVEARKDVRTGLGNGHLAYHDWKTYPYALDKNGNKCDIAAGISVKHSFEDYHIWGLWYGENEMIYYLDGQEMWRRKTSTSYPDQYYTGVGKAPVWNPLEEQRAYGKYGQEDWNYQAGYNGDLMHVILANIPWGSTWSPLVEEEADGSWMAVDYVRIYKPESLLDPTPETDLPQPAAEVELDRTYSLAEEGCSYFSTEITRKAGEELTLTFVEADGSSVGKVIVDTEGSLLTGITRLTSSLVAASPVQGTQIVPENRKMLLVCRITAKAGHEKYDKDAISVWCVPVDEAREAREPYFYPNIDENGNTSATQGWHINQKGFSDEVISRVLFTSTTGDLSSFGRFRAGRNFVCVTR